VRGKGRGLVGPRRQPPRLARERQIQRPRQLPPQGVCPPHGGAVVVRVARARVVPPQRGIRGMPSGNDRWLPAIVDGEAGHQETGQDALTHGPRSM